MVTGLGWSEGHEGMAALKTGKVLLLVSDAMKFMEVKSNEHERLYICESSCNS